jgi:hypothetical protein
MSDLPHDYHEQLDLRDEIARIDRNRAETQKLFDEAAKLRAEEKKFDHEGGKLRAEERKFNRDPWFLIIGAIIAAIATRLPEILHALGLHT